MCGSGGIDKVTCQASQPSSCGMCIKLCTSTIAWDERVSLTVVFWIIESVEITDNL